MYCTVHDLPLEGLYSHHPSLEGLNSPQDIFGISQNKSSIPKRGAAQYNRPREEVGRPWISQGRLQAVTTQLASHQKNHDLLRRVHNQS